MIGGTFLLLLYWICKVYERKRIIQCRHNLLTHFPRISNEKILIHKMRRTLWVVSWKKLWARRRGKGILILSLPIVWALSKLLSLQFPHFYKEVFEFINNFFQLKSMNTYYSYAIIRKDDVRKHLASGLDCATCFHPSFSSLSQAILNFQQACWATVQPPNPSGAVNPGVSPSSLWIY